MGQKPEKIMTNFIPDTDKTITLPVGIDFREPGQPSPYRDKEWEQANKRQFYDILGGAGTVDDPYARGQSLGKAGAVSMTASGSMINELIRNNWIQS